MKAILTGIGLLGSFALHSQNPLTVYFDFNKHNLTHAARIQLDSFLLAAKKNVRGYIINLDGYCDPIGSTVYNKTLSVKRVSAVKKYLLSYGIEPGSIGNTWGHGEKDPLNENKTAEERQLNRRVEIGMMEVVQTSLPVPKEMISLEQKIADTATKAGTNIILRNINFFGGLHQFLPESEPMLNELLEAMRAYPKLIIRVEGHICCQEFSDDGLDGETGNYDLSEARAKAVRDYLLENGIGSKRVSYKGFGHSAPIYPYPERTEEERIANRRVEIKIISK